MVNAARELMAGQAPAAEIGWTLLAAAALIAVFVPLTVRLYYRRS
ncbi:MAG: hypothetical protein ACOC96_00545 [Actinomycetota bacterium]